MRSGRLARSAAINGVIRHDLTMEAPVGEAERGRVSGRRCSVDGGLGGHSAADHSSGIHRLFSL